VEYTDLARPYNPLKLLKFRDRATSHSKPVSLVKIINRYVLKEHVGPFVFALSALTSLLLLQYIARKFGDLVGRGLSWQVITEFMLLSIPFTVAMTLPMAVLVAVLHAFSRMASENEITALKAGGISTRSLMRPALVASTVLAFFMLWFNDQVLPRTNHELATLQVAILRTKPSFALKEQVINGIKEGQLYLRAGYIDREQSGRLRDVTIYDVSDASRRRTIFGDSGYLAFAPNKRDILLHLYHGWMMSSPTTQPEQLNRIYYKENELKVRDVANSFQSIDADTASKGEREMSVCEMQKEYALAYAAVQHARLDSIDAAYRVKHGKAEERTKPKNVTIKQAGGIGALYCSLLGQASRQINKLFKVKEAHAEVPPRPQQDTTKKPGAPKKVDSVMVLIGTILRRVPRDKIPPGAYIPETTHVEQPVAGQSVRPAITAQPPAGAAQPVVPAPQPAGQKQAPAVVPSASPASTPGVQVPEVVNTTPPEILDAKLRLEEARHHVNRYGVEIQKKFSLAAACIVFVLVGAPIALRFPRGGVGVVIGVSFFVFAVYYVGLIGGESLANNNLMSPFWAMWLDNVFFLLVGLLLISRMGREGVTSRGGSMGEMIDATRAWFARRRHRVGVGSDREAAARA
jgi:lipopolysaccharide export system permease protein